MAAEGDIQADMNAHVRGYSRFTALMKWGAIGAFIVAFLVILMIS